MSLVLTRRHGEALLVEIGPGVVLRITLLTRTGRGQAQLAIDGPAGVRVVREEIASRRIRESAPPAIRLDTPAI